MSKRKRDPTFASSEKIILIELVERHFDVVESKKTDSVNVKKKNEEWQKIATEFNSLSSVHPRDWSVLKNCWENLKKRAKQCQTQRNQHFLGTGGGPPKKNIEDPAIEKVLELIQTRVTGFINTYDSDGTHVLVSGSNTQNQYGEGSSGAAIASETTVPLLHEGSPNDTNIRQSQDQVVDIQIDWSQYTPNMLRRSKTPALARSPSPFNEQLVEEVITDSQLPEADVQLPVAEPQADANIPLASADNSSVTVPRVRTTRVAAAAASATTSRRRPESIREREVRNLNTERINTLLKCNLNAEEEHKMNMSILKIKEAQEREILEREKIITRQEKIKLEMLEIQLQKLKE